MNSFKSKSVLLFVIICFISSGFCVTNFPTKTACESYTMSIVCPYGQEIQIHAADYGRSSSGICPHANDVHRFCYAKGAFDIVKERCNGLQFCEIQASNVVFGDPCPGTAKYLFVQYRCSESAKYQQYQQSIQS